MLLMMSIIQENYDYRYSKEELVNNIENRLSKYNDTKDIKTNEENKKELVKEVVEDIISNKLSK